MEWVMFDHSISRRVEIAHTLREMDVRTGRSARLRSRPLAQIQTGYTHTACKSVLITDYSVGQRRVALTQNQFVLESSCFKYRHVVQGQCTSLLLFFP